MGADWYNFYSVTVAAIPVPKGVAAPGFKLMTIMHQHYDIKLQYRRDEYHGAMICLADTGLHPKSVEVIGPYEIERHKVECMRMKHLDAFMPVDAKDKLASAFETYTGRKPDVVPGFWTTCATSTYLMDLHTTWSLGIQDSIVGKDCGRLRFSMHPDADDSDA
ncbi:hypothetical protein BGX24_009053 [Mortierella sp. AD032]|nr:hypothetical protein BGX24_009053 [Mortierella sp. AD032]